MPSVGHIDTGASTVAGKSPVIDVSGESGTRKTQLKVKMRTQRSGRETEHRESIALRERRTDRTPVTA